MHYLVETRRNRKYVVRYIPLILLGVVIIVIGVYSPYFLTTRNLINILRQSSALGLMAIGMSFVLIAGGIDLSVPSVMALSGILGAMFMRAGGNPVLGGLMMIFIGLVAGIIMVMRSHISK
jgi:ribose transport system permease protein